MSIFLMTAIWEDETIINPTEKLLLLALADHADDDGVCWPSIERLARRACISTGQTTRLISKLVRDGRIVADRRGGRHRASVYQVLPPACTMLQPQNPRTGARVSDAETRASTRETRASMRETRASMRAQSSRTFTNLIEREDEKPFYDGGEGKASTATSLTPLPDALLAIWDSNRWPLTDDKLVKFLHNAEREFSLDLLLDAIAIMNDAKQPINKPAAYLKRVLQNRIRRDVYDHPVDYTALGKSTKAKVDDFDLDFAQPEPEPQSEPVTPPTFQPDPTTPEEKQAAADLAVLRLGYEMEPLHPLAPVGADNPLQAGARRGGRAGVLAAILDGHVYRNGAGYHEVTLRPGVTERDARYVLDNERLLRRELQQAGLLDHPVRVKLFDGTLIESNGDNDQSAEPEPATQAGQRRRIYQHAPVRGFLRNDSGRRAAPDLARR